MVHITHQTLYSARHCYNISTFHRYRFYINLYKLLLWLSIENSPSTVQRIFAFESNFYLSYNIKKVYRKYKSFYFNVKKYKTINNRLVNIFFKKSTLSQPSQCQQVVFFSVLKSKIKETSGIMYVGWWKVTGLVKKRFPKN